MISEAALEEMNEGGGLTDGGDIKLTLEYCDSLETTEGLRLREEDMAAASRKSGVLKDILEVKPSVIRPVASFSLCFPKALGKNQISKSSCAPKRVVSGEIVQCIAQRRPGLTL